ncbi:MAG: hypothetical protein HQL13_05120 [Candidatus Omnitrophica bacterium]|nr:hypothetical protein [Candidatus Omnitrophota bacterium]
MMKLHVGCGTKKLEGWINIDGVKSCHPDLVHDLSLPLPYADLSADELKAEGVLEHLDKYMRYCVFGDWARTLKVGGLVHIGVPNFKKLLSRFFKFNYDDFVDTFFGENMWESEIYLGHYGNHKWGYSKESLTAFIKQFGIDPVEVTTKDLIIFYTGRKVKHVPVSQMDQWKIYSHNNKFGAKRNVMTLAEIKQKIKEFQVQNIC